MSAQLVVTQRMDKILTDLVKKMGTETVTTVSYTHLTLPTKA